MKLFRKILKRISPSLQTSYSQFGEDLILNHLFQQLNVSNPTYLDIGANEPKYISNTYYFYSNGSTGVLVEPNPELCYKIRKHRPKDIVIQAGVGPKHKASCEFYLFPKKLNGLSTFSKKEANHWEQVGMKGAGKFKVEKTINMPIFTINEILEEYFQNKLPDFISIDVEGLDLSILESLDFNRFQPKIFCIETITYDDKQKTHKNYGILNLMYSHGYKLYADTWVNSIFIKNEMEEI